MWQIVTGRPPYRYLGQFNPVAVAFQVGFGNLAPEQLPWPAPFDNILPRTFAKDHHQRPKFTEILQRLKSDHHFCEIEPARYKDLQVQWARELSVKYGDAASSPSCDVRSPGSEIPNHSAGSLHNASLSQLDLSRCLISLAHAGCVAAAAAQVIISVCEFRGDEGYTPYKEIEFASTATAVVVENTIKRAFRRKVDAEFALMNEEGREVAIDASLTSGCKYIAEFYAI